MTDTFGGLLTEWCWLRELSIKRVARLCAVDPTHIGRLFKDERHPSTELVSRLAVVLELRPRERALFYLLAGLAPPDWRETFGFAALHREAAAPIPQQHAHRALRRVV